jgi:hypothetical protein
METGREVHGDKWDETPTDGSLSLREMMELHKDELLEYKQAADSHKSKEISRKMKQSRIMALPIVSIKSSLLCPILPISNVS